MSMRTINVIGIIFIILIAIAWLWILCNAARNDERKEILRKYCISKGMLTIKLEILDYCTDGKKIELIEWIKEN